MLAGKKILIGITGSIAAYKSILLVRLLVKAGASVKIVMTPSAKSFVSPLVLSTLSRNEVLYNIADESTWANHVMLGRWADVMLIAPCSANTLAKMAKGICDNLLLAVYLSATCPVVVSPAMDEDMWHHPATKKNISTLRSYGNDILPAEHGELASGLVGEGRMPEPGSIVSYLAENYFRSAEFQGRKALVTAGPTHEAIDPVRFIGNHSSGKMGLALAECLYEKGADVTLVCGPGTALPQYKGIKTVAVITAAEMFREAEARFNDSDIIVMSAAVADYSPAQPATEKIKKSASEFTLSLVKTPDILKSLGEKKSAKQFLVGFALETNNEEQHAIDKLKAKKADMIVLNSLNDAEAGFGKDTNKITVFSKDGDVYRFPAKLKRAVASDIIDLIIKKHVE